MATANADDEYDAFDLSTSRANAVRQVLKREGLAASRIMLVAGKGDGEPLFPEAPTLAANRRVYVDGGQLIGQCLAAGLMIWRMAGRSTPNSSAMTTSAPRP